MECLVKKLVSVVDNSELPMFGYIGFKVKKGDAAISLAIECLNYPYNIKLVGDGSLTHGGDTGKDLTINNSQITTIDASGSDCMVYVGKKYGDLTMFNLCVNSNMNNRIVMDLSEFEYVSTLNSRIRLSYGGYYSLLSGSMLNFVDMSLTSLRVYGSEDVLTDINEFSENFAGKSVLEELWVSNEGEFDVSKLAGFTALEDLRANNLVGNFETLANNASLTSLYPYLSAGLLGSVEAFVAIAKLRGAGSIGIDYPRERIPNVTWNGNPLSSYTTSEIPQGFAHLNWDASGNISWS